MPELSRRLKRQRFWDDHAEIVGRTIMYVSFTVFILALLSMTFFDTPMRWTLWLLIPIAIGSVIEGTADEPRIPEAHSLSTPPGPPRRWRRRRP